MGPGSPPSTNAPDSATQLQRLRAVVRGRVQGVGFRAATADTARALGLRGWVRNRLDGTVEVVAEGPPSRLRQLEGFLRQGPRMSNVSGLDAFWEDALGDASSSFEVR